MIPMVEKLGLERTNAAFKALEPMLDVFKERFLENKKTDEGERLALDALFVIKHFAETILVMTDERDKAAA